MGMVKIQFNGYLCERCHHQWIPMTQNKPKVCPKCKSPYWDIPRRKKGDSNE